MTQKEKNKDELIAEIDVLRRQVSELQSLIAEKTNAEKFQNSKVLLQRIIDLLPIRIFWKDSNFRYLGCNEIFAKDAGKKSTEEIIGRDDFEMSWKDQAQIYREDDRNVLFSGKEKLNFEEPQTTPEGKEIWLKTSKVAIRDSQGNVIGVLGTYEEITERKRIEKMFRQNEEKILSITDSSQDAIIGMNALGKIDFWNKAATRILGYSPEEAMGMNLHELIAPERFRQSHAAAYPEFLRTGKGAAVGKTLELAAIRKDGIEIVISLSLSDIQRSEGWCAVGVIRDITAEVKAKEIEKKQRAELEVFYKASMGREERILELKKEIETLRKALNEK